MSFSYRIRHQIPGRLRLKIAPVRQITDAGAQCSALEGVLKVRINAACASLIVHYDCSRITHTTLLAALQQGLEWLTGDAVWAGPAWWR